MTAPAASNFHYDRDARIFELFLDPSLKYSAALFAEPEEDLAKAQERKLDFIVEQLGLGRDSTLLDVGCGWGSLVCHAARRVGCRVVGVTPARAQAEAIRRRLEADGTADRVEIVLSPFEDLELADRSFDAIGFVGSIVHVRDKRAAIARCHRALRAGGRVYLSETCFRSRAIRERFDGRPGTEFIRHEIFGDGDLLPLSDYVSFFEDAGFSLVGLRDLTRDYRVTIERWRENARRNQAALRELDPALPESLERYFETANAGWGYTSKQYALTALRRR